MRDANVPDDAPFDSDARARAEQFLDRQRAEAEKIAENAASPSALLDRSKAWLREHTAFLKPETRESLTTIFRMVGASVSGEWNGLSKSTLVYLIAALLYCVSPLDAIPDAIPVLGLVDDAFVVAWTLKKLAGETKAFREWERLKAANSALVSYSAQFAQIRRVVLCPGWLTANESGDEIVEILRPVFPNAIFDYYRWPSNASWTEARGYVDGPGAAAFEDFLRNSPIRPNATTLIGHSLGSRLAVRTLARLARAPKTPFWNRRLSNRFAQAFLTGAAVDSDDADLPDAVRGADAPVVNFFSRSDRVLGYLYPVAEQKSALGLSGAAVELDNYVDRVVSGREEYWLDVAENVASVLTFLQSRSFLGKFSLAESVSRGLPEFHRHQFKRYAAFFRDAVAANTER